MKLKQLSLFVSALALAACGGGGGGGGGGSQQVVAPPNLGSAGIYDGQFTENSQVFDLSGAISSTGRATFFSEDAEFIYSGNISEQGSSLSANLTAYELAAFNSYSYVALRVPAAVAVTANFTPRSTLTGTSRFNGSSAAISLNFDATTSDRTASLATLAGQYRAEDPSFTPTSFFQINITESGVLTGTDDLGCTYSSSVEQPKASLNLFHLNDVRIVCPGEATRSGNGLLTLDGVGITLIASDNEAAAVASLPRSIN